MIGFNMLNAHLLVFRGGFNVLRSSQAAVILTTRQTEYLVHFKARHWLRLSKSWAARDTLLSFHLQEAFPLSRANMSNAASATRALFRATEAVCFDVDSTVCRDEAIDELAKFAGKEKEVAEMTRLAMRGGVTFREALSQRLDLIRPSMKMIQEYLKKHPPNFTPGIEKLVDLLHSRGINVYLVSGGFDCIIHPIAKELGIPEQNVFANKLKFYYDGEYAGFDENEPTSQQDGKAQVIAYLKHRYGYQRVVMVGDGATDLEACPPADAFIGFGGNQVRDKVKKEAKWYVMSFYELIEELNRN